MKITTPQKAYRFFKARMMNDVEEFWVAALNTEKKVVAATCLFRGTVDGCLFHPRDVFRFACLHNAVSVIVAHNHPSGNPKPSIDDIRITERLVWASEIMTLPVDDHMIVAGAVFFSFKENGLMKLSETTVPDEPSVQGLDRC